MSGTTSGDTGATTSFGAGDNAVPAAVGGGGSAGPSVGEGNNTGPTVVSGGPAFDLPGLPPQYSTAGGAGFFTRQMETVPTSVTRGPDGALYVGEFTALPYPEGYARVLRIADPNAVTGFDGEIPSGVPQTYASGFSQINGLSFDGQGNLYVLEYVNGSAIYDPTRAPDSLPPSQVTRVAADGVRTTITGDELRFGNYVLADEATGDVLVSISGNSVGNGQVLRYQVDPSTGAATGYEVVAEHLNNPRSLAFGPDGDLYVLEQGRGTDAGSPDVASAPVFEFIPGLVSERGGNTGSITRVDLDGPDGQKRVFTGLASFREFNPTTGQDRIVSIGPNGLAITPDGTAFVSSGAGLSTQTAATLGAFGDTIRGVVRVDGLFDGDASDATITPTFDSVAYAGANGPDGATTLFNNQSLLNGAALGADGKLYAVDSARNVLYGLKQDGATLDSVTVLQKRPPVLTPPQYAAVVAAGGDPSADYKVEITERTLKNANGSPDTPGRAALNAILGPIPTITLPPGTDLGASPPGSLSGAPPGTPPAGAPDPLLGAPSGAPPGSVSGTPPAGAPGTPPPGGLDAAAAEAGVPGGFPPLDLGLPVPLDPVSPSITPGNPFELYFDPYFGTYAPATPPVLPAGERGSYTVSNLYSFGDRLVDDGGDFGAAGVARAAGLPAPNASSVYYNGGFSDGLNWTANLARILGVPETGGDANFAYVLATARPIDNPLDPFQGRTSLNTFAGQIDAFEGAGRTFLATDLVTVTFGGNDLTLPSNLPPEQAITASVDAIVVGLERLADLGAEHFLVANVANVELAPLFSDPAFLAALGAGPGAFEPLVDQFNAQLGTALTAFEDRAGLDVNLLDVNRLFDAIDANPLAYGFANVDQPVLLAPPLQPGTPTVYNPAIVGQDPAVQHATLFVDPFFHPTALGHSIIAETARDTLLA